MRIETDLDSDKVYAIEKHYFDAREKHPYFCDLMCHSMASFDSVGFMLKDCRDLVEVATASETLCWDVLVRSEVLEALEAVSYGDTAHAVEECYDAIAVLLRTIDVLEGRQKLGKPETKGETK